MNTTMILLIIVRTLTTILLTTLTYTFTEIHTISGRSAFSWGKEITHTDTIKHVNCPVLKSDTVYVD